MLHLRLFLDAGHADAHTLFAQWPELLAGLSIGCDYLPVQASGLADGEAMLQRAWARAHRGLTPGRWPCALLLNEARGLPPPPIAPMRQHALDDPQVKAALAAARAERAASGHALEHGVLLQAHMQWWVGIEGVKAWRAHMKHPDKP
jgi:hypothetical protein